MKPGDPEPAVEAFPAPPDSICDEKARLRTALRRRLVAVADGARREAGRRAADHLAGSPAWHSLGTVAAFVSLADEIDTAPLIETVWSAGKRLLLPRVLDRDRLDFAEQSPGGPWHVGRFGIREPRVGAPSVSLGVADLVVVPALAFDRRGGRLGRGAGYYDRALAPLERAGGRPMLVGLALAVQLVDRVPRVAHDVLVDRVLTERGFAEGAAVGPAAEGAGVAAGEREIGE